MVIPTNLLLHFHPLYGMINMLREIGVSILLEMEGDAVQCPVYFLLNNDNLDNRKGVGNDKTSKKIDFYCTNFSNFCSDTPGIRRFFRSHIIRFRESKYFKYKHFHNC